MDTNNPQPVLFAKLRGVQKVLRGLIENPKTRYLDPQFVLEPLQLFRGLARELKYQGGHFELYREFPDRPIPKPSDTTDNDGRGYILRGYVEQALRDLDYLFEVRSHADLGMSSASPTPRRVFLTHGRNPVWRAVQAYIEKDLELDTLELDQEANTGRTVLQKLDEESQRCSYAVVVMTGDDRTSDGQIRTRENVMHEIGYFQGRFGLNRVTLLYQEGTNVASNLQGLVYIPFPGNTIDAAFAKLSRELRLAFP